MVEPFWVSKEFWYRKVSSKGGGSFTVLSKILLSHRTEKTSPGNHSVFQKIFGREKYFMEKGGGVSRFSVEVFVSLYRNIPMENTLVFQKSSYQKFSCIGGGVASRFCRNFLSHRTESKSFVKEPFCFPEIFWYQKKLWIRGGL